MFKLLKSLFGKSKAETVTVSKQSKGITKEMIYSLQDGIKLSDKGNHEAALEKFDIAIESGIFDDAYRERGYCLQLLGFHLDSIEDFTKAIKLFPTNANNYYGRALSNSALGYYDKAIADVTAAIELSQVNSKENNEIKQVAIEKNIASPTFQYKYYLDELYLRKNEPNEQIRQIYISPEIRRG